MASNAENEQPINQIYLSFPLLSLSAEKAFPGDVFLCIRHRMVKYKNKGDHIDSAAFNKLIYNRVKYVFIAETDRSAFEGWVNKNDQAEDQESQKAIEPEAKPIADAIANQRRAMMDIFDSPKDDKQVKAAIEMSKKMVSEFLRKPFAVNNIQAMQKYSKGCVDHSVNVSVLSVFLGLRMGYSHQLILENLAMGGLFHDIGKTLIESRDDKMMGDDDPAMQQHPKIGMEFLDKNRDIANEVKLIVAQHHEFLDGSGYPSKLKGLAVYDLARLVAIANVFDNLITQSSMPTFKERVNEAVDSLEKNFENKLDPKKLEKVTKILRYSMM